MSNSSHNPWSVDSHHAGPGQQTDALAASHSILDSLRQRRGSETAAWLNSLVDINQISTNAAPRTTETVEQEHEHQLIQWIDKLFDQFDLYSARFNHTAQGTDLVITTTRPNVQNPEILPPAEPNGLPEKIYEGHLVTRFWAMLLRGNIGAISVYIIPAEVLLGFSLHRIDESIYKPLMVINSCWKDNRLSWDIGGTCIVIEQVPMLAKELFGDLIRVASGQMSEEELFAHSTGEHLAVDPQINAAFAEQPAPQSPPVNQFVPQANTAPLIAQIASAQGANPSPMPRTSLSKMASIPSPSTSQSRLPAQAAPQLPPPAPAPGPIEPAASTTLAAAQMGATMIAAIDADMNQLIQLGKTALTSEDTETFHKLKLLTERLDTLKQTLIAALTEIAQITAPSGQANPK